MGMTDISPNPANWVGKEVELVLKNDNPTIEKDALQGVYKGTADIAGTTYFVIRMSEFGNTTYIPKEVAKAIHVYPPSIVSRPSKEGV